MNFCTIALILVLPAAAINWDPVAKTWRVELLGVDPNAGIRTDYPYYHTTRQLTEEVERLSTRCDGQLKVETYSNNGIFMDVAHVSRGSPKNHVLLMAGEHARELISTEAALHFLKGLCGNVPLGDGMADPLSHSKYTLILSANPLGRQRVEIGNYCWRNNPKNVDINRNWDWSQFEREDGHVDERPAFSEKETKLLKQIITETQPNVFFSVHSGTRGLYMPYANDTVHKADKNHEQMMQLLQKIDARHCQCPYGAAGQEVGYAAPGTSLDWVYGQPGVSYSFAFEMWAAPRVRANLDARWRELSQKAEETGSLSLLQDGQNLGHADYQELFDAHPSDFVGRRHKEKEQHPKDYHLQRFDDDRALKMSADACFETFNPSTKEEYDSTVAQWSELFLHASQLAAENLNKM